MKTNLKVMIKMFMQEKYDMKIPLNMDYTR